MSNLKGLCIAVLLTAVLPATAAAQRILVEAEDYTASYNIGGTAIYSSACGTSTCLLGLDLPSEWAEYRITNISSFGTYSVMTQVWGDLNILYHLKLAVIPDYIADPDTIDIYFIGKGRCGA